MNYFHWPDFNLIWNWVKKDFQHPQRPPIQRSVKPRTHRQSETTSQRKLGKDWAEEVDKRTVTPSMIDDEEFTEVFEVQANDIEELHANVMTQKGYKLVGDLGSGGYGSVHKLKSLTDGKEFAVKIQYLLSKSKTVEKQVSLNAEQKKDQTMYMSFKQEVVNLQKFSHKNIIRMYKHFIVNDIWSFIIMEFASGSSLKTILYANENKEPFDEGLAKVYTAQIAKALQYMHNNNIAHKDLKLDNVLVDYNGSEEVIKVNDFGMSGIAYRTGIGSLMESKARGTVAYMSPELIKIKIKEIAPKLLDKKVYEYDPFEADLWAFGVCIYEMLHKDRPFHISGRPKPGPNGPGFGFETAMKDYSLNLLQMLNYQTTCDWKKNNKVYNGLTNDCKDVLRRLLEPDKHLRLDVFILMHHKWLKGLTEDEWIHFSNN